MILQPGVLALLIGSAVMLFLVAAACVVGVDILRHWDYESSSARQLNLERRTYLVSTVVSYALAFGVLSFFLFLFTADEIHRLLVGAMCATGSLNANPVGWYVLLVKAALLLLAGGWIALNYVDQQAEDYPLVRFKYALLLCLFPLVAAEFYLQLRYFLGITPDVITSCCGALFSTSSDTVASTVASLPPLPTLWAFYSGYAVLFGAGWVCHQRDSAGARCIYAILAAGVLALSLVSMVSVLSLYFYENPIHHCPFDILQGGYSFIGYPVYGALVVGSFLGMMIGVCEPLRRIPSLRDTVASLQRKWLLVSVVFLGLFVALATYRVVFSNFRLVGYA